MQVHDRSHRTKNIHFICKRSKKICKNNNLEGSVSKLLFYYRVPNLLYRTFNSPGFLCILYINKRKSMHSGFILGICCVSQIACFFYIPEYSSLSSLTCKLFIFNANLTIYFIFTIPLHLSLGWKYATFTCMLASLLHILMPSYSFCNYVPFVVSVFQGSDLQANLGYT